MDLKEVMAVNLRRLRHDKKMTQEELAHRAGISARYVGRVFYHRADLKKWSEGTRRRSSSGQKL